MRFSIITPTYKRPELLRRTVNSLFRQTYSNWEIIIVNDSPDDRSYDSFINTINDPRIHYYTNKINSGVNFSKNFALEKLSADSKWVIFLDDDDYFAPDTLETFALLIQANPDTRWFVTNHAYRNGKSLTRATKENFFYSYAWKYLILKRLNGNITHCISTSLTHKIRFSEYVKNEGEWFFFYQVGLQTKMFYHDHNSTIVNDYDEKKIQGLRKQNKWEQFENICILLYEGTKNNLIYHPSFLLCLVLHTLRLILKT